MVSFSKFQDSITLSNLVCESAHPLSFKWRAKLPAVCFRVLFVFDFSRHPPNVELVLRLYHTPGSGRVFSRVMGIDPTWGAGFNTILARDAVLRKKAEFRSAVTILRAGNFPSHNGCSPRLLSWENRKK